MANIEFNSDPGFSNAREKLKRSATNDSHRVDNSSNDSVIVKPLAQPARQKRLVGRNLTVNSKVSNSSPATKTITKRPKQLQSSGGKKKRNNTEKNNNSNNSDTNEDTNSNSNDSESSSKKKRKNTNGKKRSSNVESEEITKPITTTTATTTTTTTTTTITNSTGTTGKSKKSKDESEEATAKVIPKSDSSKRKISAPHTFRIENLADKPQVIFLFRSYLSKLKDSDGNNSSGNSSNTNILLNPALSTSSPSIKGNSNKSKKLPDYPPVLAPSLPSSLSPQQPPAPQGNLSEILDILIDLHNLLATTSCTKSVLDSEAYSYYMKWFDPKFTATSTSYIGLLNQSTLKRLRTYFATYTPQQQQSQQPQQSPQQKQQHQHQHSVSGVSLESLIDFTNFDRIKLECENLLQPYYLHFAHISDRITLSSTQAFKKTTITPNYLPTNTNIPFDIPTKFQCSLLTSHKRLMWNFYEFCKKALCAEALEFYVEVYNFKIRVFISEDELQKSIKHICDYWLGMGTEAPRVEFDRHNVLTQDIRAKLDSQNFERIIFDTVFDSIEMSLEERYLEFLTQLQKTKVTVSSTTRGLEKLKKILTT